MQKWLCFPQSSYPFTFTAIHTIVINCISASCFISVVGPLLLTVYGTIQIPFCLTPQRLRRFVHFRECDELYRLRLHSSSHSRKGEPPQVARRRKWLPVSSIYLHEKRQINRAVYLFRSSLPLNPHCLWQCARVIHELSWIF